ncbi:MAG: class I SAM-dependent methyltransferase [Acidimicrobiales bacterium]|nr:class I SAM-dependent methyltransferase [Acidimicrobiales bacterium]MCB9392553.1 class I SAM-dependent methyltransferase [Acidimicrobiaceae bacterium]
MEFYARLLQRHLDDGVIAHDDSVFVQFAGTFDEQICAQVGLTNCTFGNIAPGSHSTGATSAAHFDAHRMPLPDGSFDHVFAHAGLHHCSRPHEALHEMYRLARKTVVFVENQDSLLMRLAARAGVVPSYEPDAVRDGGYTSGGVDGTGVPNHVYRWTRREVDKAVTSFDPGHRVPVTYDVEWNIGGERAAAQALSRKLHLGEATAARVFRVGQATLNTVLRRQGNIFAATIRKDLAELQPWMRTPTAMRDAPT